MEDLFGQLNHYRTQSITQTLWTELYERTDSRGYGHLGIRLEQRNPNGTGQVFKTDLDQLEAVTKRAEAFAKNTEKREHNLHREHIGDYSVTFVPWPTKDYPDRLAIHLEQTTAEGRQSFVTDLDRLNVAVRQGQSAEQDLGFTDRCFHLVYGNSLREENGQTKATVFKSVWSIDEARKTVWGNSSFALYSESRRRPIEPGANLWMSDDASVEFKGGFAKTVEGHNSDIKWNDDRLSKFFVVASWNDVSRNPKYGEPVRWEGSGQEHNGKYVDFRARPGGFGEQGEPPEPIYVLLRTIPGKPFHGTVEAMSTDRQEIVDKHKELLQQERALQENRDQTHRMTTSQWREQSFGVDREQHTRDFKL